MIKQVLRHLGTSARKCLCCAIVALGTLALASWSYAEDEELRSLELYYGAEPVETVSATRSPRPASQSAENITVVTAAEIEALNAHTLADILYSVPGIQLEEIRTPGTSVNIELQGSNFNHILVLLDNVPINNFADNFPDIGSIPVQIIERVEIVKGAASSSWGNALGGVINIITKPPMSERPLAGTVSASFGKEHTSDSRAEVSGGVAGLGYYLSGGNLHSAGLLPNNGVDLHTLYGKLTYDLPVKGTLGLTAFYSENGQGQFASPGLGLKENTQSHTFISALALQYPLTDHLRFDGNLHGRVTNQELKFLRLSDGFPQRMTNDDEASVGTSLGLSWVDDLQRLVTGIDYYYASINLTTPVRRAALAKREVNRVGFYLNDTFTVGHFAITPSARFDHTDTGGELFSPSLGITYALTENTVLRGYTSRGYSLTSLTQVDETEKVWTSQIGVETGDIPYVWLKATLFRNDTWNIRIDTPAGPAHERQLKQGGEVEVRTLPIWNTQLSLGYTYMNSQTDLGLAQGVPKHTIDVGIKYQDARDLRAQLVGHYIDWHRASAAKYGAMIWDLHLGKKFAVSGTTSLELFVSIRNLFNGDQYLSDIFKNPRRWGEAGIRCAF